MAITTMDGLVASFPGQLKSLYKTFTPQSLGFYTSLLTLTGIPGAGVAPSSGLAGDVPSDATAGAIPFTNPGSGNTYLGKFAGAGNQLGTLSLYDRLWHNSGVSATSTSAQTINSVALTRPDANGEGVEAWFQIYATMGSGTPTLTISYTNQDGTSGRTGTSATVTTMAVGRTGPFTLESGDTGVRSIQSLTLSATMSSGTIGLVLRRRIASVVVPVAGSGDVFDIFELGMPQIYNDACLEFVWLAGAAGATLLFSEVALVQG
jgi:hypothetical protein